MASNPLKVNAAKQEFIWCAMARRLHHIDSVFNFDDGDIVPTTLYRTRHLLQCLDEYDNLCQSTGKLMLLPDAMSACNAVLDTNFDSNTAHQQLRNIQSGLL